MLDLFTGLEFHACFIFVVALIFSLIYEAINGFHDTANAVATIIYTRSLRYQLAVAMSGVFNLFGVMMGGLSVAYAIVHIFPTDLLLNVNSSRGVAMIFSMLMSAIVWNLCTWYLGLPSSSSHTLIGAIMGIGLTHALSTNSSIRQALNIPKLIEVLLSLIISPIVGLTLAGLMVFFLRHYWSSNTKQRRRIHMTPVEREKKEGKDQPPFWIRIALILSSAGVSYSHGANDGQKGIGLIMLVLISTYPSGFVVNMDASSYEICRTRDAINDLHKYYIQHPSVFSPIIAIARENDLPDLVSSNGRKCFCSSDSPFLLAIHRASFILDNIESYAQLDQDQRSGLRRLLIYISALIEQNLTFPEISHSDKRFLDQLRRDILKTVEYAPMWITIAVALSLSLGTLVGCRRVVITIGERIGKKDMTYAQGLSAQITAAVSIGVASYTGMPVSTTHVLSSAVTGTMLADGTGVQVKTVKNILIAWVLTLPFAIILSGGIYLLAVNMFF